MSKFRDYRKLYIDKTEIAGGEKGWKSFKLNLGKTVRLSTIGNLKMKISVTPANNQLNTGGTAYFDDFEKAEDSDKRALEQAVVVTECDICKLIKKLLNNAFNGS